MSRVENKTLAAISLGALGIVFGDIGTSPLYAFEQVFSNSGHSVVVNTQNVLGVISLFLWSLIFVVAVKYVNFIMKADNQGEGGIIALLALSLTGVQQGSKKYFLLLFMGVLGAAFFYGDGVITPAISVLSAVEGISVISPSSTHFVLPISIFILICLFYFQKHGTSLIGKLFGPVMLIWFLSLGVLGVINIASNPLVLNALNPLYALNFLINEKIESFFALGAVVLCLTGAEALYADMGHFGKKPIRIVWYLIVLPSLILNYFGQGALLLLKPEVIDNLFYSMSPAYLQTYLVVLATIATVIASQAVISGAFSMTREAIQLGLFPRFKISQTSANEVGQIYLPIVNYILCILVVGVILVFKSSNALGSAYGIAVTGTMLITDFLAIAVVINLWKWSKLKAFIGASFFILVDLIFFSSNTLKIVDGGWLPLLLSSLVIIIMSTWFKGNKILISRLKELSVNLDDFLNNQINSNIQRLSGIAFHMTSDVGYAPLSLINTIKHFNTIHEKCYIVTLKKEFIPYVGSKGRFVCQNLGKGFFKVEIHYGFMERINIPKVLFKFIPELSELNKDRISYFVGRQILSIKKSPSMALWRKKLFKFFYKNSDTPLEYFSLPEEDAMAISVKVEL